jgi:hypothetical protein
VIGHRKGSANHEICGVQPASAAAPARTFDRSCSRIMLLMVRPTRGPPTSLWCAWALTVPPRDAVGHVLVLAGVRPPQEEVPHGIWNTRTCPESARRGLNRQ